jgi:hypothetical protein
MRLETVMWTKYLAASGIALMGTAGSTAQSPSAAPSNAVPVGSAVRDPQTIAALEKMGGALHRLHSFTVRANTTEEKVLTTGQKIQFVGMVETRATRPDKLRIDRMSDRQERRFFFDGKQATLYSPRMGFYASVPVSGTIQQAVAAVAEKYNLETPLADLFAWGEDSSAAARIQSAFYVGAETIAGIPCDQYAIREPGTDWQVWIRQKGQALPCKLVITATDQPSMPQYSATFTWSPAQTHPPSTFVFAAPKGSHKIALVEAAADTTVAN